MRRPLLAALLALPLCGCRTTETDTLAAEVGRPFTAAAGLLGREFAPDRLARRFGQATERTASMLDDPAEAGDSARTTLARIARQAEGRIPTLRARLGDFGARVLDRVRPPRAGWLEAECSPARMGDALRTAGERTARLLAFDQRALGEQRDLPHRTDPDDDGPEPGWLERIFRRILP